MGRDEPIPRAAPAEGIQGVWGLGEPDPEQGSLCSGFLWLKGRDSSWLFSGLQDLKAGEGSRALSVQQGSSPVPVSFCKEGVCQETSRDRGILSGHGTRHWPPSHGPQPKSMRACSHPRAVLGVWMDSSPSRDTPPPAPGQAQPPCVTQGDGGGRQRQSRSLTAPEGGRDGDQNQVAQLSAH